MVGGRRDGEDTAPIPSPGPVLLTGASSGIGRAVAERLRRADLPVYATARRLETIRDLIDLGCEGLSLDVTDAADRERVVARIEAEHGAVGALVNNAGYGQQGPLEETPLPVVRDQFETNLFGPIALCQRVLPAMRRRGRGRIVNVSSLGGRVTFPGGAAYHGSKHALEAMSDVLRFEVAGFGIPVVLVEPGPTSSAFGAAALRTLDRLVPADDGAYDALRAGIEAALAATFSPSAQGNASAEDVAEAVYEAIVAPSPPTRIVVGESAAQMIEYRARCDDPAWDALVAGMYPRPGSGSED